MSHDQRETRNAKAMKSTSGILIALMLAAPGYLCAQGRRQTSSGEATKVGPAHGTVIVVGGGSIGSDISSEFLKAAGGPDALIIDVPTASGDTLYSQNTPGARGLRNAGAKNVYVLHTSDRRVADSDSFVAIIKQAHGVWFDGGRHFRLVDSYAGTKTETAFREVLARGGAVGGSSAGATILGDFLVRGAPSENNMIMDYPGYEKGFAYLRGVAIDQHVVARERLADLADSIIPKYPYLLGISEDEGTAWLVRGDTATIVGRNKAFAYNGNDKPDVGKPFLTLYPGDRYNLATRRVTHRAAAESPVSAAFVDNLFRSYSDPTKGGAAVLIAQGGKVYVDRAYGIAPQPKYMPTTTVPQFPLGDLGAVFGALCAQLPEARAGGAGTEALATPRDSASLTALQRCLNRRVAPAVGLHKTNATADDRILSDVDELYRFALGLEYPRTFTTDTTSFDAKRGWIADKYKGVARLAAYGDTHGRRNAFVRIPDKRTTIILLTNDDSFDAKSAANTISERLITNH
jgi:cyanophycinase